MGAMKTVKSILIGVMALAGLSAPQAMADRYSDYWAPENMAKRQCTSVHLGYKPDLRSHTAAYTEMVIEKSAPGTYFAANNFGCGYIGVQELTKPNPDGTPRRVAIFSIWDAKDSGDNPNAAPEEERARLVQRGEGVRTDRFGGEGTGGKSMRRFDWKEGDVIRTLVIEREDGPQFRQIAGYIFDPQTNKWELMSCWRIQALTRGLGGGCGFVEDFCRNVESKKYERRATFGPALKWDGQKWLPSTLFRFTKDGNPNMEINCRFNPARGFYSLATGGDIKPEAHFPVFETRPLPQDPPSAVPAQEVTDLVKSPKLELVTYPDNGQMK